MANHAYVIPRGAMPSAEQVNKDAQAVVMRKFPQFTLAFDGEKNWHLKVEPDDGYLGLIFWLDEYGDPATWDEKTEECSRNLPCIEFRHGHSHEFMWWVEYEIREELARLYNAYSVDDADGKYDSARAETYDTYKEYLVRDRWRRLDTDPLWKDFLNQRLDLQRASVPDNLKPLIGDTIK